MSKRYKITFLGVAAAGAVAFAGLEGSYVVPSDHEAIQYSRPASDAITELNRRIASGEMRLAFDPDHGYLPAVLEALKVPIESQVLVFSKTSFQAPRITPRNPRSIFFNDRVTIGWVRTGDVVEATAVDPRQGVIFYTLDQEEVAKPRFERRDQCLQCHATGGTLGVPGLVVRSVYPEPSGMPLFHAGGFVTDHRSPLKDRWGGWFVTGTHGAQHHMGNAVVRDRDKPDQLDKDGTQNVTDLRNRFDTGAYLSPHSDLVALMTLEHQTHMTNLITRVGWETRMALHYQAGINKALGAPEGEISESTRRRIQSASDELVEYLLFAGEAPLEGPVKGTSGFARYFSAQGPRDGKGRGLRDFDLEKRMFRYPCSFLIYSDAFDALPEMARDRVYRRMWEVLSGKDQSKTFARLTAADRQNILDILRDTKPGLPEYFQARRAADASSLQ
jgi:hypothetical protein